MLEHLAVVPSDVPLVDVQAIFRHDVFPLEAGDVNDRLQLLDIRRPAYSQGILAYYRIRAQASLHFEASRCRMASREEVRAAAFSMLGQTHIA